jgi:hypothetical protein
MICVCYGLLPCDRPRHIDALGPVHLDELVRSQELGPACAFEQICAAPHIRSNAHAGPSTIPGTSAISWLTQATIITALATLFVYWYAFNFETGFCGYFHIPYHFISLNPGIIIGTSWLWVALLSFIFIVIMLTQLLYVLGWCSTEKQDGHSETRLLSVLKVLLITVAGCLLLYSLVSIAFIFRGIGIQHAENLEQFPVFVSSYTSSEVAVIRSYGEYLYAVPFTRKTNEHEAQFESKLVIVKMSDVKAPLSFERIGPLKPKQ